MPINFVGPVSIIIIRAAEQNKLTATNAMTAHSKTLNKVNQFRAQELLDLPMYNVSNIFGCGTLVGRSLDTYKVTVHLNITLSKMVHHLLCVIYSG